MSSSSLIAAVPAAERGLVKRLEQNTSLIWTHSCIDIHAASSYVAINEREKKKPKTIYERAIKYVVCFDQNNELKMNLESRYQLSYVQSRGDRFTHAIGYL